MKILVINAGSSSLKFQILEGAKQFQAVPNFHRLCKGIVDNIGLSKSVFKADFANTNIEFNLPATDHKKALRLALNMMLKHKIIKSIEEIGAVGHRVVHGGKKYRNAAIIDEKLIKTVQKLFSLAPLHNPPNLKTITECKKLLPKIPQVAVFDTAFHQSIGQKAYLYALPGSFHEKYGIRRYGFHGTSNAYVSQQTIKLLKKRDSKIVICHLGNGSSITAIRNGKSVDTSMGFTPLEGLPMGTRSGDIDPAIVFFLIKKLKVKAPKIEEILDKESGLKALSELSPDVREIWAAAKRKNPRAVLTLEILAYRTAKYIGAYTAAMNGLDAITFTAGIGENAWYLRQEICNYLGFLGLQIDNRKNKENATAIHSKTSKIKVFVIPTDEEKQIAIETFMLIGKSRV